MAESIENIVNNEQAEVTDERTEVTEKNEDSLQEAQEPMEVSSDAPVVAEPVETAPPVVEDEPEVPKISITLKTAQDQRVVAIAAESADVKLLKTAAATEFGVSAERLCFILVGKVLQDDELLSDNGIEDGSTLHLVIKSHIQVDSQQGSSDQSSEARPTYDPMLFACVGLESLNYGQLQQHMQRQMLANPDLIRQMVQNPLVLQLMENPGVIVEMISANPQTRDWLKRNPELAEMLNNKDIMQQSLEFAKNPELLKGLMEGQGQGQGRMQFVGASSSGHGKFSASLPELPAIWHQMAQKPQILQQLYNAPYMKPFLETLSANPQLAQQMVANPKLFANNPAIQQQMQQMMPYYLQQLQDPQLKSMVTNPKAMQAMIKIQRGLDLLQQEAPNLVSSLGVPTLSTPPQLATFAPVSDPATPPEAGTEDAMSTVLSQVITQIASGQISKPPEERFSDQLEHLAAMGFTDHQTNLQVLTATFGDLGAAVEHLNRQQS